MCGLQYRLKTTRDLIVRKRGLRECGVACVACRQVAEADPVTVASLGTAHRVQIPPPSREKVLRNASLQKDLCFRSGGEI